MTALTLRTTYSPLFSALTPRNLASPPPCSPEPPLARRAPPSADPFSRPPAPLEMSTGSGGPLMDLSLTLAVVRARFAPILPRLPPCSAPAACTPDASSWPNNFCRARFAPPPRRKWRRHGCKHGSRRARGASADPRGSPHKSAGAWHGAGGKGVLLAVRPTCRMRRRASSPRGT